MSRASFGFGLEVEIAAITLVSMIWHSLSTVFINHSIGLKGGTRIFARVGAISHATILCGIRMNSILKMPRQKWNLCSINCVKSEDVRSLKHDK